mgnify:CR=1 FL=1
MKRILIALFVTLMAPLAAAQFPDRPITMIVPFPPGGVADTVARPIAEAMSRDLKQPVVIENRGGANGAIGSTAVAQASKDGYTLVWVTADTHAMNPHVYPKLAYQLRDFAPVGIAGYFPYALFVSPGFAASNVPEFVSLAKQQPGKITFGSWGVGGSAHVAMEMFKQQAGFDVLHVPFQGAAPAIQAVIGGHVNSMIVPLSVGVPHANGGRLKMLGLAAPRRLAAFSTSMVCKQ